MAGSKDKQDPSTRAVTSPKARPHMWRHEDSAGTKVPSLGSSSWKAVPGGQARAQQLLCAGPATPSPASLPFARAALGRRESGGLRRAAKEAFIGSPVLEGSQPCDGGRDQGGDQSLNDKGSTTGCPCSGRTFQGAKLASAKLRHS